MAISGRNWGTDSTGNSPRRMVSMRTGRSSFRLDPQLFRPAVRKHRDPQPVRAFIAAPRYVLKVRYRVSGIGAESGLMCTLVAARRQDALNGRGLLPGGEGNLEQTLPFQSAIGPLSDAWFSDTIACSAPPASRVR